MSATLSKKSLQFLKDIANNNDRNWFAEHKPRFEVAYGEFKTFMESVNEKLAKYDQIEKMKVYRIYRDVRFSKNKAPYKSNFSGGFTREGKMRRGGLFFSFAPGQTFVGGGFWGPNAQDLKFIRDGIIREESDYRKILESKEVKMFGGLTGDELKTAPRGYEKDHPAVDLIRKKQFLLTKEFSDKQALSNNFADDVVEHFKNMLPYFNFMTELLVFDENGIER